MTEGAHLVAELDGAIRQLQDRITQVRQALRRATVLLFADAVDADVLALAWDIAEREGVSLPEAMREAFTKWNE